MTAIHETAYPRLKANFTSKEIQQNFTPTEDELLLLKKHTKTTSIVNQFGFLVTLKCYQCLGRPTLIRRVPVQIKSYIATVMIIDNDPSLNKYDQSSARKRHIKAIRTYLSINTNKINRKKCMKNVAITAATTKENLADIINVIIEELIKSRFELPVFSSLLRLARASRVVVSNYYYNKISEALSERTKNFIDDLFEIEHKNLNDTPWNRLKQEPKKPSSDNVKAFIEHINQLKTIHNKTNTNIDFIPVHRISQFVNEAISLDASDMKALKASRRYCLAVILIDFKLSNSIDDIVSILIRWVRRLHTDGRQCLDNYRLEHTSETDSLINLLYKMLTNLKRDEPPNNRLLAVENCIEQGIDEAILQCEKYLAYANDNYFSFLLKPYSNKRYLFFNIIEQLNIKSSSQDISIEEALYFIKTHRGLHKEWIEIQYHNRSGQKVILDLNWLSEKWFRSVTGKTKGAQVVQIHRKYYELAVLSTLVDDLNCGDAYVTGANFYDDPNKQLIPWDQFYQELEEYCALVKIPNQEDAFIAHLQNGLRDSAYKTDASYQDNEYLHIENGDLTLKSSPAKDEPKELAKISQLIADRMPLTNIVDVITDVEKWLNLSRSLKPISGYEPKMQEYNARFVSTTFAYGCNVGPTQAERCLQKFSRKQIAWLFNHHVTEIKLNKMITKIINIYNKFSLPKRWGVGDSVSVDATHWDMYQQNILAEHHIRYGDYGGLGYYHLSDLYIALYSNFIHCGVHESSYLFDGIIENDSELQPNKVHGDTGAQSEVVFGFSKLLGIQLMPRIRNFKHLRYYKAFKEDKFNHIESLFCEEAINWELIKTHAYDMMRMIMSIRAGKIKSSTILRKLCSKSRKNKLYFAFRELGRVERTIFLLNYINDVSLRQMIQAATCKSEEFNNFISWVRFGDGGTITDNMRYNQLKIIKCGHLVANMVILHVVANMTKVINTLRSEGLEVKDELLRYLCPFRTEHINRLGIFLVDIDRDLMSLEYDLIEK